MDAPAGKMGWKGTDDLLFVVFVKRGAQWHGSVVLEPSKATHHDQSAGTSNIMSLAFAALLPWLVMVH